MSKEAKGLSASSLAKCPYCVTVCSTRKELMRHLDVEHDDGDDAETEPELKIVRVDDASKHKFLGQLQTERLTGNATLQPNRFSIVNNLLHALESKDGSSGLLSLPGTNDGIKLSTTSIKLQERKYRCFWCDASFRKRGKLMDHIDMFHKANKHQTEVEAELLHVTVGKQHSPVAETVAPSKPPPFTTREKKATTTALPALTNKTLPPKFMAKKKRHSLHRSLSSNEATIDNKVCKFMHKGHIIGAPRGKPSASLEEFNSFKICTFFNKKSDNPISPVRLTSATYLPATGMTQAPVSAGTASPLSPGGFTPVQFIASSSRSRQRLSLSPDNTAQCVYHAATTTRESPKRYYDSRPPPDSLSACGSKEMMVQNSTIPSFTPPAHNIEASTPSVPPSPCATETPIPTSPPDFCSTKHPFAMQLPLPNSPTSPNLFQLARPQLVHPMFSTALYYYQRQMSLSSNPHQLYLNHQQQQQQRQPLTPLDYQQRHEQMVTQLSEYNYPPQTVTHDPNSPLDLTLAKYM